jgi:hypothetical protein
VIFALLTWPELMDKPLRALAGAAGVSLGMAQATSKELQDRALWPDDPTTRELLLDAWLSAYPDNLARSITIRSVRAEQFERFYGAALPSGEAAPSAHMRATGGVVYVDRLTPKLLAMNRWRTDGEPNLVVRHQFWNLPELRNDEAPALLVCGDLHASADPRVRAVAAEYKRLL